MNAAEIAQAMLAAKADCDSSVEAYRDAIEADAVADDDARRSKAREYVAIREQHTKATVGLMEAMVDTATADAQKKARLAEGLMKAAAEAVRNSRQWLSALQSLAAASRAEAELAKWEPREVAS